MCNILHTSIFLLRDRNVSRSVLISITAQLLLQYVHNFTRAHRPSCITTEKVLMDRVFITSCHAMHLRQRAILIAVYVTLHNRKEPLLLQWSVQPVCGVSSLLFQRFFKLQHLSKALQRLSSVSLHKYLTITSELAIVQTAIKWIIENFS